MISLTLVTIYSYASFKLRMLILLINPFFFSYAPHGLRLLHIEECRPATDCPLDSNSNTIMRLRLTPDLEGQPEVVAECLLDHPFFVKDKGLVFILIHVFICDIMQHNQSHVTKHRRLEICI